MRCSRHKELCGNSKVKQGNDLIKLFQQIKIRLAEAEKAATNPSDAGCDQGNKTAKLAQLKEMETSCIAGLDVRQANANDKSVLEKCLRKMDLIYAEMMDVDWACVKKEIVMANGRIITRALSTHGVKAVVPIPDGDGWGYENGQSCKVR